MNVGLSNHQPVFICVCVPPPLITFEPTWWIWMKSCMEVMLTEDDLVSILFDSVALTIPKWQTFKI
jgi:hypothetical protein